MLAITLTLTLHFSSPLGGAASWSLGSWQFDASPQIWMPFPTHRLWGASATTFPLITLYDPEVYATNDIRGLSSVPTNSLEVQAHELHHYRQSLYLGPWFWIAYVVSNGNAFEPYEWQDNKNADRLPWTNAWMPPTTQQNYPVFRVSSARGFQLFPGYIP